MDNEELRKSANLAESRGVVKSAAIMAAGTLVSRVLGLFRDVVVAALFDRMVTDAWAVAVRLPNLFRRLLGEGSLSVSFIPVFVDVMRRYPSSQDSKAREFASGVFTLVLGFVLIFSVAGTVFIEDIVRVLVSGEAYMDIPGKFALTVKMARIMFGFIFLMSLFAYYMAILNSLKRFAAAALAPSVLNIVIMVTAFVPREWCNFEGEWLSWGVILGGVLQVAVMLPSLIQTGFFPWVTTKIWSPDISRVVKSLIPSLLGMGIVQITGFVNIYFASRLPQGTHSWIYLADRLLELPLSLFAVSMGTALLPTLARLWAQQDKKAMIETSLQYLKVNYFVCVPAAVGLWVLALPIVEVLYMRGRFRLSDAMATAEIVQVYSLAIITSSGVRVMAQSFYAIGNTWFPAMTAATGLASHLVMAPIFMEKWGVVGLVGSTVTSAGINLLLILIGFKYWFGELKLFNLLWALFRFGICALVMGGVAYGFYPTVAHFSFGRIGQSLMLGVFILISAVVYFMIAQILRIKESEITIGNLANKIKRRFKS